MGTLLSLRDVILEDGWPGYPDPNLSCPTAGFDDSAQCSSTPVWPVGTKIQAYNDSTYCPGYFTMIYLPFVETSDIAFDIGDPSTGYCACFHLNDASEHQIGDGSKLWYLVTNDLTNSDGSIGGAVAFAAYDLSGMSGVSADESNEYGWFWCSGVNPCITLPVGGSFEDCTRLAGDMKTDDNIVQGGRIAVMGDGTGVAMLVPYCFTVLWESTTPPDITTPIPRWIGTSMVAD